VNFVFSNNPSIPTLCSDEQLNDDSKEQSKHYLKRKIADIANTKPGVSK
jgi:hypothetical protein